MTQTITEFLTNQTVFWWLNQSGIGLEILGAMALVIEAFKNRQRIKNLENTWGGRSFEQLRDAVANQAITEFKGFVLIAIGLLLQMLGSLDK